MRDRRLRVIDRGVRLPLRRGVIIMLATGGPCSFSLRTPLPLCPLSSALQERVGVCLLRGAVVSLLVSLLVSLPVSVPSFVPVFVPVSVPLSPVLVAVLAETSSVPLTAYA